MTELSKQLQACRWIFFDLGYTLIDESVAEAARFDEIASIAQTKGVNVSVKRLQIAQRNAWARMEKKPVMTGLDDALGGSEHTKTILKEGRYRKELEKPFPRCHKLLSHLQANFRLGVLANQPPGTPDRLRKQGLLNFFSLVLGSGDVGLKKPDPNLFALALEKAECLPHETAMVGDRIDNDIKPAKKIGMLTIRVLQGFGRFQNPRNETERPAFTVESLDQFLSQL